MKKKKGGKPLTVLTDKQIQEVERLASEGDTIEEIGAQFGVAERTFCDIKNRQPAVSAAYNKGRLKAKKIVRKRLFSFIHDEDKKIAIDACKFWLKTQDGWREREREKDKDEETKEPMNINISFAKE